MGLQNANKRFYQSTNLEKTLILCSKKTHLHNFRHNMNSSKVIKE